MTSLKPFVLHFFTADCAPLVSSKNTVRSWDRINTRLKAAKYEVQKPSTCRATLERLSMTFTTNGKNETFAICLQLSVQ